ncbi:CPBP family intramembrane glutamic endopeptidase [Rhizobacter sp. Root1221]|uniref:CPBP family intramembrane glutamic endopeptidase n=1 Tax=Rhizobacter sp. Root1221 TaxID=1736433 RepID=UPI0006F2DEA3|nr:CPBP family intramembrane glutamic endopeptidase [Rhizobacter sp. Root1221]KQV85935.1 hypothetical protein ASC87_29630 [Rhizobacter sp. Root1221]
MLLTSLLLGLSIISAWCPPVRVAGRGVPPWMFLLAATLASATWHGLADVRGVAAVAVLVVAAQASLAVHGRWPRALLTAFAAALALALGLRLVPGFVPIVWVPDLRLSPDADPFRFTAHVDPGAAGLVLLACYAPRCLTAAHWRATFASAWPVMVATTVAVIGLAWGIGHVHPDFKWPWFAAAFLAKMLLWTCVMEEAFFRGLLQERLMRVPALARGPGLALAVGVPAGLFGLAHAAGGWAYVGLATLAGVGYGIAYARTRRIEAAIATHFVLNAVHFVAFTYPRVAAG